LALLPGFPLAHWMAATVHIARQAIDEAEREITAAIAAEGNHAGGPSRFTSVALHWLLGLIHLSRGEASRALQSFERELAAERSGHLYARECAANTWYAIGALHWRDGRADEAREACRRALERIPTHPMAHVLLARTEGRDLGNQAAQLLNADPRPEAFVAKACGLVLRGEPEAAAALVEQALAEAPPGNAGWIIPVEPVLGVATSPSLWAPVLARLRVRAA
jgi:tetratricopeptide (TPR) repeat protein